MNPEDIEFLRVFTNVKHRGMQPPWKDGDVCWACKTEVVLILKELKRRI